MHEERATYQDGTEVKVGDRVQMPNPAYVGRVSTVFFKDCEWRVEVTFSREPWSSNESWTTVNPIDLKKENAR